MINRNFIIKNKSFYYKRKNFNLLAKQKFDQIFKLFINVYLKRHDNINERYLKITCFQSVQLISDALYYYPYLIFKKDAEIVEISHSASHDLVESANDLNILDNINTLSKRDIYDFNFKKNIRYSNPKENKLSLLVKIFLKLVSIIPIKKRILTDIIDLKLYFKLIKKGFKPIFLDNSDFNSKINLQFDKEIRKSLYEEAKLIFLNNQKDYNALNLLDIFVLFAILPIKIVENFSSLKKNLKIPKEGFYKKILISQIINAKDEINFWLAGQILKNKTPIEIIQHGSGYFILDYDSNFSHEVNVSDKFYCWAKKSSSKFQQHSITRTFNKNKNKKYDLLMIPSDWSYLYAVKSMPFGSLIDKNRSEQINFIKNIKFTKNFIIKKPPVLYAGYKEIMKKNNLNNEIVNTNLTKLVPEAKIIVCSYVGTTFFELMANDTPFITFTKLSENSFSEEFNLYMKKLKNFNFLFYSSYSAAKFLNENHHNFFNLWNDVEFSKFREEFRDKWCKKEKNWQEIFIKNIY